MTDDQFLLANAYVDGELDAVGRTQAESDPDVMREVELLTTLRADLRDVAPASSVTRTAAIAAALDAWSPGVAAPLDPPAVSPETSRSTATGDRAASSARGAAAPSGSRPSASVHDLSSTRARRQSGSGWSSASRWLGAAAAVVGLGIAGLVVINSGNDDASGSAAVLATTENRSDSMGGDDSVAAESAASDEQFDSASAVADASAGNDAPQVAVEPPTAPVVVSTLVPVIPLSTLGFTSADLKETAERLLADTTTAGGTDESAASADDVALFDCELPMPENSTLIGHTEAPNSSTTRPTVTLLVVVDETQENAYAIDSETCFVVLTARLDY